MNFSNKIKTIIIIFLLLNVFLGGTHYFIGNRVDKNINLLKNISNDLDIQLNKERQLRSFKNITEDTTENRQKLDSYFVSEDGVVDFIQEIESLASISNLSVEIGSVDVSEYLLDEENKSEVVETLNMKLSIDGSWSSGFYFLTLLESMPYRVNISGFNIDIGSSEEDVKTWQGNINISVLKIR